MRRVGPDNDRSDMNSGQVVKSQALWTQGAYGSTSETIQLDYGFSFHSPNHDYSFEFHPIKTALRPQGTTAILGVYDLHFQIYGSLFEDPQIKCNIGALSCFPGSI